MAIRIVNPLQTLSNLGRMTEIVALLVKYGFGDILGRLGVTGVLSDVKNMIFRRRRQEDPIAQLTTDERIRCLLEELGPTFVKLGQVLATRPDLIPMSLTEELRKLQDKVPPFSEDVCRRLLQNEYGRPVEEVFAEFDPQPLAAASIAQVHRARLKDGPKVILKVRRPNIERVIENDLDILEAAAELAEERLPDIARRYNPVAIVAEFRKSITKEIDLTHEARNIKRFARNFAGDEAVHVPEVFDEFTTPGVLCEEFIEGVKATSDAIKGHPDIDLETVAKEGIRVVLTQTLVHGFFHADPHPGNIFVLPGNKICLVDFGMMGSLQQERIDDILSFLVAILTRNVDKLIRILGKLDLLNDNVDLRALRRDVSDMIDEYYTVELAKVDIGRYLNELLDVINAHQVILPPDLLLVGKSLATIEGVARDIYPDLDPVEAIRPFILKIYINRLTDPGYFAREPMRLADDAMDFIQVLPREARAIVRALNRGELDLGLRVRELDKALDARAHGENRLALALMLSAGVLASSYLIASAPISRFEFLYGMTLSFLLGVIGLLVAGFWSLVFLVGFYRSGGV